MANIITNRAQVSTEFHADNPNEVATADLLLAKRATDILQKNYPYHLWAVNVNSEGGVMVIKNYSISYTHGMVLHLKNVYQDPTLKRVVRSGGELLERAHVARNTWDGQIATELEGAKAKYKPRNGIVY